MDPDTPPPIPDPAPPSAAEPSPASDAPPPIPRPTLCPYCGHTSDSPRECDRCKGLFEPLSRQASQNAMGPWYIRDEANPFRPGCSYATMRVLVARKRIVPESVLRGPSTRQFWMLARNTPGVAHLLGECHACHRIVSPTSAACPSCGARFSVEEDRQYLGLAEVRLLPGQASPEAIARKPGRPAPASRAPDPEIELAPDDQLVEDVPTPSALSDPTDGAPAYEPIRHPARTPRAHPSMSDAEVQAMLERTRTDAGASARRTSTIIIALVIAAALVVLLMLILAIAIGGYSAAQKKAAPTSGAPGTTTR